jgi:hypothetical protein
MREATAVDGAVVEAARAALLETTSEDSVGEVLGLAEPSDGVTDVHFANTLPGYPGWSWSVSVSTLDGTEHPSVLELSLLPGDDSLVAPEWVPWSERLADYRAAQEAKGVEAGLESDEDESEDDEAGDELVEEEDILGDDEDELDGVDFEEVAVGTDDDDSDDEDDDDDDDSDDDDSDDDDDEDEDDEDDDDLEDEDDLEDDYAADDDLAHADEGTDQDDTEEDGVR